MTVDLGVPAGASAPGADHPPCTRETRQCGFTTWGKGYERPACCTAHVLELLTYVHELLDANGIVHWLDYGTLLGAVRDGRLIPWDDDADMAMLQRDGARLLAARQTIEAAGYRLHLDDYENMIRVYYSEVNHNHVDVFQWRERDGLLVCDEDAVWQWPGMHDRQAFPASYLDQLEEVTLHGRQFPAPSPVHDFLSEHRYGPDYMTPQRPILNLGLRPVIDASEVTPRVTELLARVADRNERLVELVNSGSRLLSTGSWTAGHTRWLILSGLPLRPRRHALEAARASVPPEERTQAVDQLVQTLAWIESAIAEWEHPPMLFTLRRTCRGALRMIAILAGRSGAFLTR
jgi:hypothetical protein